ncbi:MAG: proline--tRNA ligase, partial [Candidatus Omnitrophica bacterium]|nr:proline--tRNA ligase [Candidatus Omnitrophota bacterium]
PVSLAPFPVVVIPINMSDSATKKEAFGLHEELLLGGVEVLLDDREVSGGVKLKDADLIGFPIRILLSEKTLQSSSVEVKLRRETSATLIKRSEAVSALKKLLDKEIPSVG